MKPDAVKQALNDTIQAMTDCKWLKKVGKLRKSYIGLVPVTGLDYTMVSASSSRQPGKVHRTVPFDGFEPDSFTNKKHPQAGNVSKLS